MHPALLIICVSTVVEIVYSSNHPKRRAPLGFTGVRGKKSITEEDSSYSDISQGLLDTDPGSEVSSTDGNVDKRAPSGFMGMRGKKPFPDPNEVQDEIIKRTPSGFLGMRGKKDAELDNLDNYPKAVEYDFAGMLNKQDYESDRNLLNTHKRAPSGFMGMRGKKIYDSYIDELKRAQMSGFFGMRGKKSRSGFFGMRGKKYPYEFRGKFVGVRGKKSNEFSSNDLSADYQDQDYPQKSDTIDMNQLMLLLTANNRSPMGNGNPFPGRV